MHGVVCSTIASICTVSPAIVRVCFVISLFTFTHARALSRLGEAGMDSCKHTVHELVCLPASLPYSHKQH